MSEIRPNLRKKPTVKLYLDNVQETLKNITGLENQGDRIRSLQHYHKILRDELSELEKKLDEAKEEGKRASIDDYNLISQLDQKRKSLTQALKETIKYEESALNFQEKISLLFEIVEWDKDPIQRVELECLANRYGKDFALYFLSKKGITSDQLFDSLKILLSEVSKINPNTTLAEIVKQWPSSLEALSKEEIPNLDLFEILSDKPGFYQDPEIVLVVRKYLLPFLAPITFRALNDKLHNKEITADHLHKEVGSMIYQLRSFRLPYEHYFTRFSGSRTSFLEKRFSFEGALAILRKKIGGKEVEREAAQLAQTLLYRNFNLYISLLEREPPDESKKVEWLRIEKCKFNLKKNQLQNFILESLRNTPSKNAHHLIANFMHVARLMAELGDFETSMAIFSTLEKTEFLPELKKSWKKFTKLEPQKTDTDYHFLKTLLSAAQNFKAYRNHIKNLEDEGKFYIPLSCVNAVNLNGRQEHVFLFKTQTQNQLQEFLSKDQLEEISQKLKIEINHLLDDTGKLRKILNQMKEIPEPVFHAIDGYDEEMSGLHAAIEGSYRELLTFSFTIRIRLASNPIKPISEDFLNEINRHDLFENDITNLERVEILIKLLSKEKREKICETLLIGTPSNEKNYDDWIENFAKIKNLLNDMKEVPDEVFRVI
ncbi:MAG: hypothetical protein JJU12_02815 [Chlamydiales bacterium]|nr:hypothetical protein [Chlamydiales bacterium]